MDSWEWNKIAGALLGILLFVLVVNLVVHHLFDTAPPKRPGYAVELPEEAQTQTVAAAPQAEPVPDFATILPLADVNHGKDVASRCVQCHDVAKTGLNRTGPTLWGLIGRARASQPGYTYSTAMAASHAPWTYETLYSYLKAPMAEIPATKMSFVGLTSSQDRLDLLAYLRTLDDNPAPLSPDKK